MATYDYVHNRGDGGGHIAAISSEGFGGLKNGHIEGDSGLNVNDGHIEGWNDVDPYET